MKYFACMCLVLSALAVPQAATAGWEGVWTGAGSYSFEGPGAPIATDDCHAVVELKQDAASLAGRFAFLCRWMDEATGEQGIESGETPYLLSIVDGKLVDETTATTGSIDDRSIELIQRLPSLEYESSTVFQSSENGNITCSFKAAGKTFKSQMKFELTPFEETSSFRDFSRP